MLTGACVDKENAGPVGNESRAAEHARGHMNRENIQQMNNPQHLTNTANDPSVGRSILIVDDDDLNLKLFTVSLSKRGYRVLLAMDARLALDLAHRERPDLIIMDVQLPDMSGLEATRMLKSDDPTRAIPILITTAFLIDKEELQKSGCDAYLGKPYPAHKLIEIIASLMPAPPPAPVG